MGSLREQGTPNIGPKNSGIPLPHKKDPFDTPKIANPHVLTRLSPKENSKMTGKSEQDCPVTGLGSSSWCKAKGSSIGPLVGTWHSLAPELMLDATLDCTGCSTTWSPGHGAISCPSCKFGHVRFQKKYSSPGSIDDAVLDCSHCQHSFGEGYGGILSPCCGKKPGDPGFVKFTRIRKNPVFCGATLSCTSCPKTWQEGFGAIKCPRCCDGFVEFKVLSQDATLQCTQCSATWSEGHGGIRCPCCEAGFVKFARHWKDGPLQDAALTCTSCKNSWGEGCGAIKCPRCSQGFVRFTKISSARHLVDAFLTCTDCEQQWSEGYGAIPCPHCLDGFVRFTKHGNTSSNQPEGTATHFNPAARGRGADGCRSARLHPEKLHFTQDSIKRSFRCGRSLQSTIRELQRNPRAAFESIPIIQVFELDGKMWTADNRRLYCFRQARLSEIPVRHIHAAGVDPRKFTTGNGGLNIRVR